MAFSTVDTVNEFKTELTIEPDLYSNTKTGTGIDFQDCAAEFTADLCLGMIGADSNLAVKFQESSDDGVADAYADISGATMTTVSTASANNRSNERKQFFNRSKRYVRGVGTMTGSSPDIDYCVLLSALKISY